MKSSLRRSISVLATFLVALVGTVSVFGQDPAPVKKSKTESEATVNSEDYKSRKCERIHSAELVRFSRDAVIPVRDDCFLKRAIETNSLADCDKSISAKADCYFELALAQKDYQICIKLKKLDQGRCLRGYAIRTHDASACKLLRQDQVTDCVRRAAPK